MKYIDAEKIIAEIRKLRSGSCISESDDFYEYAKSEIIDIIESLQQEQPEVDFNKFEKLFKDFCERNKGHHITGHDACMWFWELGLNARKEE